MATQRKSKPYQSAVSLDPDDAVSSGLWSGGRATIVKSRFVDFRYQGKPNTVPLWSVTYEPVGGQPFEQPYGIGKGWLVDKKSDGRGLMQQSGSKGRKGLSASCNAYAHLMQPLKAILKRAGMDSAEYITGDPSSLEGLEVFCERVAQIERPGLDKRYDQSGAERQATIIQPIAVGERDIERAEDGTLPPLPKEKPKGRSKVTAQVEETEDEQDEQAQDTPPAAAGARVARGKGNGRVQDDEAEADEQAQSESDAGDDDELLEEGVEALVSAVEEGGGQIKFADLKTALDAQLKGNKNRRSIVTLMTDPDVLASEKAWVWDERKKIVSLEQS